ncbi:MAG: Xaa-Pro dipeptidase, partial [Longimicrobiales bacterium]|nr:Xaa-Pro dipeptidase [Longimicrobiales bacterium]
GFDSIVGGGEHACVLHYVSNNKAIPDGGLVLIDAGAEFGLYHGDVTRTLPANGRFSDEQRAVYEVVDEARRSAIASVRPGATILDVHDAACRALTQGLLDMGVLSGDLDAALDDGRYRDFFPHQTSHWLGLDVHDPGDYARTGDARVLKPGMVFTVEPGLYFRPLMSEGRAERWSGIGIRIEDDVVVTADGVEVLTSALPTGADEVEELVGS